MSNAKTEVITTIAPVPVRRSILHSAASASIGQPAAVPTQPGRGPFADWRDATPTEALPATAPRHVGWRDRRVSVRRHLRAALAGTLLAIVAVSGISAYAALDRARSQVSVPR